MYGIQDILHRRTDLSTFLVHLTRSDNGVTAKERLEAIYHEGKLVAGSPMGWADTEDDRKDKMRQSQRVVCFSETPLEHVWALAAPIDGRAVQLEGYGVAIPKYRGRKLSINPVWYVDRTPAPGHPWKIADSLDKLREEAIATMDFHNQPAASIFPFVEPMGDWRKTGGTIREFWWEREWRHAGDLDFETHRAIFLCPEEEIDDFVPRGTGKRGKEEEAMADWKYRKRRFVDPNWGLERIIAHLAGISKDDVTPFDA